MQADRRRLQPLTFRPFPLGAIRPSGWLARQLQIQAEGLSGHLDEFWPDVKDSRWFGGEAEGWERAPYWLDGVIPLAFLLDDAALKAKVTRYVDHILTHQQADGWLGPEPAQATYDLWALFLTLKALVQYHEAVGADRVVGAVERCLRKIDSHLDRAPLFNWGQFRWFEALLALYWLYERTGQAAGVSINPRHACAAPRRRGQAWLIDLAVKLHAQGFNWTDFFKRWPFTQSTPKGRWNYMSHVVNNAMAPKGPALWWRLTGDAGDRAAAYDIIEKLDRYHGMVTGMFTGDECLAGRRPTQGTELCAVVEYAFSLEQLLSVFGDPVFGDRLEKIVFNALPATFSPDMWAHQYDQQVNQVECSALPNRSWIANGLESNLFGLEPNYGCCTANLSQGWPKFAAHLWLQSEDGGLVAAAYAPSRVAFEARGVPVTAQLETDYPFRETLRLTFTAERPVRVPLHLRIPAWATGATLQLAGGEPSRPEPGTFHRLERVWSGTTEVLLTLPMRPGLWRGFNDSAAVVRGPLVYALKMGEDWRQVHADVPGRALPHADWEVYAATPWNYALDVAETTLAEDVTFAERPIGHSPFSPDGAPVVATVKGRRVPGWQMENGSAADVPPGPVISNEPLETLTLIPYGCTNLRVTEFPTLSRG